MARLTKTAKLAFVCQSCGFSSGKWLGKCPDCESWNSFVEEEVAPRARSTDGAMEIAPVLLRHVKAQDHARMEVGIAELDRVLGGGVVPGSVILVGGDPGIGKSTISLQLCYELARQGKKILYVSGEESVHQTKLRADRLGSVPSDSLYIVNATEMEGILASIKKFLPDLVIIDSIQVVYASSLSSSAGSVSQVRECAHVLTQLAKQSGISVVLIGHVTKEGTLAGPRVLEHIVDTVLYFEGERFSNYRILRAIKNRFGSTNEIGVFEMGATGLAEVKNPSEIFLAERPLGATGTVVVPVVEGSRPILVEIQALVTRANFGVTRRKAQGIDPNRLSLLVAVLEKRMELKLFDKDVFVNVVGGMKIDDPAVDMAVCLAIASSAYDRPIPADVLAVGEVGLAAEVRSVTNILLRINEARKLGFKKCLMPRSGSGPGLSASLSAGLPGASKDSLVLVSVESLDAAFRYLWPKRS